MINDNLKEESKKYKNVMICMFIFSILFVLGHCLHSYLNNGIFMLSIGATEILTLVIFLFVATLSLYIYIYMLKYKFSLTNEKIIISGIFKPIEFNLNEIIECFYGQYKRSSIYIIKLKLKDRQINIRTRYAKEFKAILDEYKKNNITEQNSSNTNE